MKMVTKNTDLNETFQKITAAKNQFLEFIGIRSAVFLICMLNELFSIKKSLYEKSASLNCTDNHKHSCMNQRVLKN